MTRLSDYQKSTLTLLDIPQWQLRCPDLLAVEQSNLHHSDTIESPVQPEVQAPVENRDVKDVQVPEPESGSLAVPAETPKLVEPVFVNKVLVINNQLGLVEDLRQILVQYEIPHQIVEHYSASNLLHRVAILPQDYDGEAGKTQLRYSKSLGPQQKRQLWEMILSWRSAN